MVKKKAKAQAPKHDLNDAIIYVILAFFLGGFGIHNFYRGNIKAGVTQALFSTIGWITFGILPAIAYIWALIDFVKGLINIGNKDYNKIFEK